jgi:hypothetical protein
MNVLKLLKNYNIEYVLNNDYNVKFHGFGIGDLLFSIISLENGIISSPINISINFFLNQYYEKNKKIEWNENLQQALEFRLKLISDICKNSEKIKITDFCFIYNRNNKVYSDQFFLNIDYRLIKNYKIKIMNKFFDNIEDNNFIVFHTKIRLTSKYNYDNIKQQLKTLLSTLKIKNSNKIYLLGERAYKSNYEANILNTQTVYNELLELKNNNEVIDLTIDEIYNSLNYENYKRDISIINKAKWNIIIGQGGHLCNSLTFGNAIFFDPIDENFFYNNLNLYNCGHRYFKRFEKFCEYLEFEL